jgi:hypothetical protein
VNGDAPVLFPGHPEATGAVAYIQDVHDFAREEQSCRGCVLTANTLPIYGPGALPSGVAVLTDYHNDFSGAQLDHVTWQEWNSGAGPEITSNCPAGLEAVVSVL